MKIIGIDPGLDGGIVILGDSGIVVETHVTPVIGIAGKGKRAYDVPGMTRILRPYIDNTKVFLEKAQPMPGQGVSSMFSIGYGFGLWQGILTALGIPFELVHPRTWQGEMFKGIDKSDTKRASALVAARLSPHTDWRANEKCRVPHDGKTDAYAIAEYGRINS